MDVRQHCVVSHKFSRKEKKKRNIFATAMIFTNHSLLCSKGLCLAKINVLNCNGNAFINVHKKVIRSGVYVFAWPTERKRDGKQ